MKRILVYAMILMMLFALVGCGSGSEKTTETGNLKGVYFEDFFEVIW